jgi:acyl dehydratase
MPFKAEQLMAYKLPEVRQTVRWQDCALYALGVGLGADALDARQLKFVYEDGMKVLPTMAAVLAYPGFWVKNADTGVDWVKILHGEQDMVFHAPLPAEGVLKGTQAVTGIADKGKEKGAIILNERVLTNDAGKKIATVRSLSFARGDGGCGGAGAQPEPFPSLPERKADAEMTIATLPQAALIYRLSGDYNPLHADPAVAKKAGFKAPILHGLCTYGVAGHAVLATLCDYEPARMKRFRCRFTSPVYPGEVLKTEMWKEKSGAFWRTSIPARGNLAVAMGTADIG